MHELAHLICEHKPARIEPPGRFPWALRTFDLVQEREAEWLGGCLQIPRDAILFLVRRGYDNEAIAAQFAASEDMVRFRRNMTGVDKQIARGVNFFGRSEPGRPGVCASAAMLPKANPPAIDLPSNSRRFITRHYGRVQPE